MREDVEKRIGKALTQIQVQVVSEDRECMEKEGFVIV